MAEDSGSITRGLSRLNTLWLSLSVATLLAMGLFLATMILVLQGDYGSPHMELLAEYFPGYSVSVAGSFIGAFWAFLFGLVLATPGGLFYYRYTLTQSVGQVRADPHGHKDTLGETVVRIDLVSFSVAIGLTCGVAIFAASAMLLLNHVPGEPLGPHLSLLGQILPGYSVSWSGSLVGFAYFSLIGGLCAICVGWLYNRIVTGKRKG